MKNIKKFLIISGFLICTYNLNAQKCTDFHERACNIPDFSFFYNGQSASGEFAIGETSELHFVVFEGMDYYISICADKRYKRVNWKIYEDSEKKPLLFDNARQNYIDTVKFAIKTTKRFILEVTIPEVPENGEKGDPTKRCVGVLIGSRLREEKGFTTKD